MAIEHTRQHALVPLVAAILIAVLAVGVSRPVLADHLVTFGSSTCGDPPGQTPRNCISVGDNSTHYVYLISVGTGYTNAIINTMNSDYGPTDLTMVRLTQNSGTDVQVLDDDYGITNVAGWVECPTWAPQGTNAHGDRWCKFQYLRFNLNAAVQSYWIDAGSRAYMACHEMGHTLGLWHRASNTSSCMIPDVPNGPTNLDGTDTAELNNYY